MSDNTPPSSFDLREALKKKQTPSPAAAAVLKPITVIEASVDPSRALNVKKIRMTRTWRMTNRVH